MNKVVIITGASSGIGQSTRELFLKNGDIVYNLSLSCEEDEFNFKCDVSNEERVKQIINQIGGKHKHIDTLINCAGYGISGAMELTSEKDFSKIFDVNTKGTFLTIKYCLPYMIANSHIINISSTCALFPVPYRSLYCASKSAVSMISYGFALELKESKIKVCTICPGEVKTNFTKNRVKNFDTNERYAGRIANAAYTIDRKDGKRMPAIKVASKIFKIANSDKVKPMIIIGFKMQLLYFFSKFVPFKVLMFFTDKFMGGHKHFKNNPYLSSNTEDKTDLTDSIKIN